MSSTNRPKRQCASFSSSQEGSSPISSGDLSEASTQDAWQPRTDTAYLLEADMAPAGQPCCPDSSEPAVISTPFSSFCIDEDASLSLDGSKALREQLMSMHIPACVPETASTAPVISISDRALLEECFIQTSLSADTEGVPQAGQTLREQLRAALVPSLATAACSAARETSALCVAPGPSSEALKASLGRQDVQSVEVSMAEQTAETADDKACSALADRELNTVQLPENKAQKEPDAENSTYFSSAASYQSQLGPGKMQILCCEDAADAKAAKPACTWSDPASSSLSVPSISYRSSHEELRQAQVALASFPGHMTESQVSAVADVRSRMRGLAQESTAKPDAGADMASTAACSSTGLMSPWESTCGTIQRLSVVVGDRHFRSASACPADYCTLEKLPIETASSLSLPEDTFRTVLEEASSTDTADNDMLGQSAPADTETHVEYDSVTYNPRQHMQKPDVAEREELPEGHACTYRAGQVETAGNHTMANGADLLHLKDSPFFQAERNSTAAAGQSDVTSLLRSSFTSPKQPSRQALLPSSFSWKPWIVGAAITASCSLVLPSTTILCIAAASLVFVLAWNPASFNSASLSTQGKISSNPERDILLGTAAGTHLPIELYQIIPSIQFFLI